MKISLCYQGPICHYEIQQKIRQKMAYLEHTDVLDVSLLQGTLLKQYALFIRAVNSHGLALSASNNILIVLRLISFTSLLACSDQ